MRIESSLFTSREGLQANGQAISIIGDNISNSNTTGFKESRVEFADLLSEGTDGRQSTSQPTAGSGVKVSNVRQIFSNGVIEFTGRELDIAIDGNGFIISGDTANPIYTRSGNLSINSEGLLVTSDNQPVLGYEGTETSLGTLNLKDLDINGTPTSKLSIVANLDSSSAAVTAAPTNPATFSALNEAASHVFSGVRVYDSLGNAHEITLAFTKTATNTWTGQAYIDGGDVGGTKGQPIQIGGNATLRFSGTGTIADADKAAASITATPAYGNGATAGNFAIDLASFSQFGSTNQIASITQDGNGTGNIQSYEFQRNGDIYAVLDSGSNIKVGSIRLGDFSNRDGLVRVGNAGYKATDVSGAAVDNTPGANGLGLITGGSLERSTVDIADQFVNLVLYQRGYQANSQILTTAAGIIRDTIGLLR